MWSYLFIESGVINVSFTIPNTGEYNVSIVVDASKLHVSGSPFTLSVTGTDF